MNRYRTGVLALVVGVTLAAVPAGGQEPQSWIHVQITGSGDDTGNLALNLPLTAIEAMMAMAPDEIISSDGRLTVAEEHGLTIGEIRELWQNLKGAGDAEFITIQTIQESDQTVRVARAGERIEVRVEGDDKTVRIDLPLALVDALLSGEGETLNIPAALEQLSQIRGDIVRVTEEERLIRVWVDERSVQ